jgi:hypothetical protein
MLGPVITTVTAKRSSLTINNITLAPTFTVSSRGHSVLPSRMTVACCTEMGVPAELTPASSFAVKVMGRPGSSARRA